MPSFQAHASLNLTLSPPNISNALPNVKSTLPFDNLCTNSKSLISLPPPAYVHSFRVHFPKPKSITFHLEKILQKIYWWLHSTRSSSIPLHKPSKSAAWTSNSLQYSSTNEMDSWVICISVISFHLLVATYHASSTRLQERSTTRCLDPSFSDMRRRWGRENVELGKMWDVMITFDAPLFYF